jgi:ABC-type glycerol-3-phosphate transport system substrate-binding protein
VRAAVVVSIAACGAEPAGPPAIRFLHTFDAQETELFNQTIAARGISVESSRVPFARGQQVIGEILRAGGACPDLIRIDATWLAGLAARDLLQPVPADLAGLDWLPEAAPTSVAVTEAIDGLFVARDVAATPPASPSVDDLLAAARAVQSAARPYPLGLRVDGYWFVPWLRRAGGDLAPDGIDRPGAAAALGAFAAVFGALAAPPPPEGNEAPEELRRWTTHDVAYWITGPWQLGAFVDRDRLAITPLEGAPRGGQLLVVPRCASHPADGWRLARELVSVPVARGFADAFATVPGRAAALAAAPPVVRAIHAALRSASPLPNAAITPLLFDDLNPAVAAAVARDATADEAIEGVRRGWRRVLARAAP